MLPKTVRELALENPAATRLFEQLGIDYCCGGHKPLEEACAAVNLPVDKVLARLEEAVDAPDRQSDNNWQQESLTALIKHITNTHHAFVRTEAPRILALQEKVCGVHGANHPELHRVREQFSGLAQELGSHLLKEERILFPYVVATEQQRSRGEKAPASCFGSVQNPIRMMMMEHDNAGQVLRELRRLTNDYKALPTPASAIKPSTGHARLRGGLAPAHSPGEQHPVSARSSPTSAV